MAKEYKTFPPKTGVCMHRSTLPSLDKNVYLYCASEGLGSVFRGAVDLVGLAKAMQLGPDLFVTFAQTVGYPKN